MRKCVILWNQNISESSSKYARKKKIKQKKATKQRKTHAQENLKQVDLQQHNFMCSFYLFLSCILRIVALPQTHSTAHIMWLFPLIIQCVCHVVKKIKYFHAINCAERSKAKTAKCFFLKKRINAKVSKRNICFKRRIYISSLIV